MRAVANRLAAILASSPEPVLAAGRIGLRMPSSEGDLPSVVISLSLDEKNGACLNRYVREGHGVVKHESVVDVNSTDPRFTSDLLTLRIEPLPVRKNPASMSREMGADDLLVRNVTTLAQAVTYELVDRPARPNQFALLQSNATLQFGQPQKAGDKLEITHWTLEFREAITSDSFRGNLTVEVWASSSDQAESLAGKVEGKLARDRAELRNQGFSCLDPRSLGPVTAVSRASGAAFSAWTQRLGYRFAFEMEGGGESSSGTIIRQVKVDLQGENPESFSVPRG
jgi:hypothetical protein